MKLEELHAFGQSIWLDYIRRDLLTSGELARLVRDEGIRGVTTNPSIFDKAIGGSAEYDAAITRPPSGYASRCFRHIVKGTLDGH
jgi:transaldolase